MQIMAQLQTIWEFLRVILCAVYSRLFHKESGSTAIIEDKDTQDAVEGVDCNCQETCFPLGIHITLIVLLCSY